MSSEENRRNPSNFSLHSSLMCKLREANGRELDTSLEQSWVCIYVKPGTELLIAASCLKLSIPFFIPLLINHRNIVRPLWSHYVFCRVDKKQERKLRYRGDVIRVLYPPDEQQLILHLKEFSPFNRVVVYDKHDKVRVKTGALEGQITRVVEVNDAEATLKLSLDILGKTVQLFRKYDEVELIEHRGPAFIIRPLKEIEPVSTHDVQEPVAIPPVAEEVSLHLDTINEEFIKYLAKHPNLLYEIDPRRFEILVAELLADMGYEVELTPESRDGGRDILAALTVPHGKILTLVECKRYSPDRKIGIDIVERFLWVLDRKDKASCGLIATTSYFSSGAIATEKEYKWRLGLKDFDGLQGWLGKYGTWRRSTTKGIWVPNSLGESG